MTKPKSRTEQAMLKKRDAYVERICKSPPILAPLWERQAEELLAPLDPLDVGTGGEVVRERANGLPVKRSYIRDSCSKGQPRLRRMPASGELIF